MTTHTFAAFNVKNLRDCRENFVNRRIFVARGVLPQQLDEADEKTFDRSLIGRGKAFDKTLDAVGKRRWCAIVVILFLFGEIFLNFRKILNQLL